METKTIKTEFAGKETLLKTFTKYNTTTEYVLSTDEKKLFVIISLNGKIIATCEITQEFEVYP